MILMFGFGAIMLVVMFGIGLTATFIAIVLGIIGGTIGGIKILRKE